MNQFSAQSGQELLAKIAQDRAKGSPFGGTSATKPKDAPSAPAIQTNTKPQRQIKEEHISGTTDVESTKEPFISKRSSKEGTVNYCVQVRKKKETGTFSVSKTFSCLKDAKIWRDQTLAKIELDLLEPKPVTAAASSILVKDLLIYKKENGRPVEKTGMQVLNTLIAHERCLLPVSSIDVNWFRDLADDLLDTGMLPQTAASYMTNLASALKWAHCPSAEFLGPKAA